MLYVITPEGAAVPIGVCKIVQAKTHREALHKFADGAGLTDFSVETDNDGQFVAYTDQHDDHEMLIEE